MFVLNGGGVSIVSHLLIFLAYAMDCFLLRYRVHLGMKLMEVISLLCDVLYYYSVSIPLSIFSSVVLVSSNKKYLSTISTCFWFVVISAFGGGVVVTLALVIITKYQLTL